MHKFQTSKVFLMSATVRPAAVFSFSSRGADRHAPSSSSQSDALCTTEQSHPPLITLIHFSPEREVNVDRRLMDWLNRSDY